MTPCTRLWRAKLSDLDQVGPAPEPPVDEQVEPWAGQERKMTERIRIRLENYHRIVREYERRYGT